MTVKVLSIAGAIALTIAGVAWWVFRPATNSPDFPDGTYWICKHCGNNFALSIRQLGEWNEKHYGHRPACPKCGSEDTVRAVKCPNCGKFYPMTPDIRPCPYCHFKPTQ